jgi:hypothetical protein
MQKLIMDFQHFLEYVPYLAEAKLPAMAARWFRLKEQKA